MTFQILVKKFKLTSNRSIDGILYKLNSKNSIEPNVQYDSDDSAKGKKSNTLKAKGSHEIRISKVEFSGSNRGFMVSSNEGVFHYSLDVGNNFAPLQLDIEVTVQSAEEAFQEKNHTRGIVFSVYLNKLELLDKFFPGIQAESIDLIVSRLPLSVIVVLLDYLSKKLDNDLNIQLCLTWVLKLMKGNYSNLKNSKSKSIFLNLKKSLTRHHKSLSRMVEENIYTMKYILNK